MGLHTPHDYTLTPYLCHICHQEVKENQHGIEHSGHGVLTHSEDPRFAKFHDRIEGHAQIWFHPECATVMALRLAHDVMRINYMQDLPLRVVDGLQALSKANQAR